MSRLTILRAPGKTLTKSYGTDTQGRIVKTSYDNAAEFRFADVEFDDIDGLAALVRDLQGRPECCVINAAPGRWNPGPGKPVLRRLYAAVELADDRGRFHKPARSGVAAVWQQGEIEAGRLWPVTVLPMFEETAIDHVFLDFDGVLMPAGIEWRADLDYTAAFLRLKLPAEFHGRRCVYYATSSAADPSKADLGGDVIKMRLGFVLDRGLTAAVAKHWLAGVEGLDHCTLRPNQIIYTAAPRFRDGLADPLPERLGILDGDHERVAVPAIEMARTVRREAFRSLGPVRSAEGLGLLASLRMDAALERLAEARGAAGGVRSALLQAIFAYIRDVGRDCVDIDALAEALVEAAAPYRTEGEIAGYGIANLIAWAMEQAPAGVPPKPHYPARGLSAKEASAALQQEMAKAVGEAAAWSAIAAPAPSEGSIDLSETGPPPVIGIKAGAGVGKTDAVIEQIAAIPGIEELNAEMYVPEHVLAAELAERVRKKAPGLRVIVIRGRGSADKPEHALCAKAGLAEPVARAGLNVMTTLCRSKVDGQEEECEFASGCRFLAQFRDTGPAIRIFAHAAMFTPRNQLLPTPHLVVIDESFWRNAAVHSRLSLDRLPEVGRWRFRPRKGEPRKKTEDRMLEAEDAAIRARNALLDGRDPRNVVSAEECKAVAAIEWGSRTGPGITPGQKLQEQMLRWSQWQQDECLKAGRFWDLLTGEHQHPGRVIQRIELERDAPTEEGDRRHILHLHHRRELKLPRVPIILLDADLSPIIAEKFTPGIRIVDIPVRQTVRVVQVHDRSCSKRFLLGSEAGDEADQRRAARRLDELRRTTERLLPGGGLLVTYKAALERLELPRDVATLYVGNLRGRDRFKHLNTAVIAGRLEPSALLVERMARAIFGDDPEPLQMITPDAAGVVRYGTEQRRYRMTGGDAGPAVNVSVHPDPRAQAILEQIRECELLQAIARLRLVHRTKPATVYVLTNIPLDLEVTVLTTWVALARDRAAEACHRWDGVWLGSPSEQSRCAPDLWVTPAAAKQWAQEKGVSNRYKEYSRGGSYPFPPYPAWGCTALARAAVTLVKYRLEGQRGSLHRAYVPGDVFCPYTARADLEAVTGPVTKLAIIGAVYRDRPSMLVSYEEPQPLDVPVDCLSSPVMLPIEAIFRFSTAAVRHPSNADSPPRMAEVAGWHPFHLLSELSAGASA